MKQFTNLDLKGRRRIEILLAQNNSQNEIAKKLGSNALGIA